MSQTPLDASALLRRYGLRPDKRLGQNFLVDESALAQVVEAGEISEEQAVLEIGPGLGGLTRRLAPKARRLVAVELDKRLIPPLKEVVAPYPNVQIVQGDILALDPAKLMAEPGDERLPYLVVANIPYYITSALIRHLLENSFPPDSLVLTMQAEVAERICAKPGQMSMLAISVQVYGQPQIKTRIPAGAFYPAPKVDSAVLRVKRFPQPLIPKGELPAFFRIAKAGFSQKRKTLRNALSAGMHCSPKEAASALESAGIDPQRRAQTLSLDEWKTLLEIWPVD